MTTEWRAIKTVPRGVWVFVCGYTYDDGPPVSVGRATEVVESWWEQTSDTTKELREKKRIEWDGAEGMIPEFWLPLDAIPAPPKEEG